MGDTTGIKKSKILVIDDTENVIELIKYLLINSNYDVITATNGVDAITIATDAQPDLILLDILMPLMDGYETCNNLKHNHNTENIPVIFLSALQTSANKVKAFELGAIDFIQKPIERAELLARVSTHLTINRLNKELQKANQQLELRVLERTQELEHAIVELRATNEELHATTDALKESEERYRTLADYTYDWEYWLMTNQQFGYISPSCYRITGYTPQEFYQDSDLFFRIIHSDDQLRVVEHIKNLISERSTDSIQFRIVAKNGEIRWIGQVSQPVNASTGEYLGQRGSNRDITEQHTIEIELEQYRNHLEQLVRQRTHELQAERDKTRSYIETVEAIIVAIDREGIITMINRKGCNILGYDEQALIGENWFSKCLPQPEGKNSIFPYFQGLINQQNEMNEYLENKILTSNGELRLIAWHSNLLKNNEGYIIGSLSAGEDITDKRKIEEALKRELEINAALSELYIPLVTPPTSVETITQAILYHTTRLTTSSYGYIALLSVRLNEYYLYSYTSPNQSGNNTYQNPKIAIPYNNQIHYIKHLGYSFDNTEALLANDFEAKPLFFDIPSLQGQFTEKILTVPVILDNKVAAHITLVNPQRNYEISDIEAVSRLAKYFALAIQLLREDEALRISENRFRDIALSMSDLIWEIDINGRYSWCSEKITDVLGFSADELLGKAVYDKMLPDQSSKFRNTFEKAIQNKKALTDLEVWTQHKDGSQVCLLSNGVPIFDDLGNVVGYRGVDKDITERKLAESQLLATNEKLLSTNTVLEHKTIELQDTMDKLLETQKQLIQSEKMASLGVLTAGIAHEINNPINFISSNTAGLENSVNTILATFEKYKEITIENHMEKLAEIKEYEKDMEVSFFLSSITALMNGIKEGVNRTTEIIKAMRTFTRADEKEMSFVDIHTFIDTSLIILKHQHANEIEINKVFAKLPNIKCYSSQLSQLFINLLSNAIQSIDKKGTITITTSYAEKDAMVNISIKDTGCGIPLEIKQKIFDPFFTTKPVGKGTGLGLSICYDIIQKHKGQIQLISEVGKGSEFIISLPVNK